MFFRNNRPVFCQIAEEIERKIFGGQFKLGQKLPSIRELGIKLGVNPNTIVRVYEELERKGLIFTESTSGKFVIADGEKIEALKRQYIMERTDEFLAEINEINANVDEIIKRINGDGKGGV